MGPLGIHHFILNCWDYLITLILGLFDQPTHHYENDLLSLSVTIFYKIWSDYHSIGFYAVTLKTLEHDVPSIHVIFKGSINISDEQSDSIEYGRINYSNVVVWWPVKLSTVIRRSDPSTVNNHQLIVDHTRNNWMATVNENISDSSSKRWMVWIFLYMEGRSMTRWWWNQFPSFDPFTFLLSMIPTGLILTNVSSKGMKQLPLSGSETLPFGPSNWFGSSKQLPHDDDLNGSGRDIDLVNITGMTHKSIMLSITTDDPKPKVCSHDTNWMIIPVLDIDQSINSVSMALELDWCSSSNYPRIISDRKTTDCYRQLLLKIKPIEWFFKITNYLFRTVQNGILDAELKRLVISSVGSLTLH